MAKLITALRDLPESLCLITDEYEGEVWIAKRVKPGHCTHIAKVSKASLLF